MCSMQLPKRWRKTRQKIKFGDAGLLFRASRVRVRDKVTVGVKDKFGIRVRWC